MKKFIENWNLQLCIVVPEDQNPCLDFRNDSFWNILRTICVMSPQFESSYTELPCSPPSWNPWFQKLQHLSMVLFLLESCWVFLSSSASYHQLKWLLPSFQIIRDLRNSFNLLANYTTTKKKIILLLPWTKLNINTKFHSLNPSNSLHLMSSKRSQLLRCIHNPTTNTCRSRSQPCFCL